MKLQFLFLIIFSSQFLFAINKQNIEIIRDAWGVPHIYAHTDEEAAYGLAWATAEDDFKSMQENFLTARGRLAEVKGKEGAMMDFLCAFVGARETTEKYFDSAFTPKFRAMLAAYAQACNDFAAKNPDKVWIKDAFPVNEKDIITGYVLGFALMTNVPYSVMKISDGTIKTDNLLAPKGSNGFALNSNKTMDGNVYLGINSHQPLEGPYSWYEAHVHTDEGWDMLGATFPGGVTLFHGANQHLGWAHTVSFADHDDVYLLTTRKQDGKIQYKYDGQWQELKVKKVKLKVKLFWFIKIPVTKKYYESVYGPVLEHDGKYFAVRFPSAFDIRAAEQWYRMNKAKNFSEFTDALKMMAFPGLNVIYADKENNIMYADMGQFPYKNRSYDWWHTLPGDTSATFWKANNYWPYDSLIKIINPACGYVHNNNNTPFYCTAFDENCVKHYHPLEKDYFFLENNRSIRTQYLFAHSGKLSYDDFKKIKYDVSFMNPAYNYAMENIEDLLHLSPEKYPQIKQTIAVLSKWNRSADVDNKQAALVAFVIKKVIDQLIKDGNFPAVQARVKEPFLAKCVEDAQHHFLKYFGKLEIPLGDFQKLVRGNKALPVAGVPDVIAAMYVKEYQDGMYKAEVGETYIELVQFTKNGPIIESISPYGASNVEGNKHYDDQMDLFVKQQCKPMSMEKKIILQTAEKVYHPNM
ncbi:MAG TPA: penicillin acylase family protein [Chitinophagales bacterium]|nr:penicillin acylase family protein [Chitinophagales bacterium]HNL85214.1 penicillin acylase family protein [Chitinophagales bacterium]